MFPQDVKLARRDSKENTKDVNMSAKYKSKVERLNRRERKTASGYESSEVRNGSIT